MCIHRCVVTCKPITQFSLISLFLRFIDKIVIIEWNKLKTISTIYQNEKAQQFQCNLIKYFATHIAVLYFILQK